MFSCYVTVRNMSTLCVITYVHMYTIVSINGINCFQVCLTCLTIGYETLKEITFLFVNYFRSQITS